MIPDPVLVGLGGSAGAIARYLVGEYIERETFPLSILFVNSLGSLIAAFIVFADFTGTTVLFLTVGFCGAFTTFSSFAFQAVSLWDNGNRSGALLHVGGNLVGCLLAAGVGWLVATVL